MESSKSPLKPCSLTIINIKSYILSGKQVIVLSYTTWIVVWMVIHRQTSHDISEVLNWKNINYIFRNWRFRKILPVDLKNIQPPCKVFSLGNSSSRATIFKKWNDSLFCKWLTFLIITHFTILYTPWLPHRVSSGLVYLTSSSQGQQGQVLALLRPLVWTDWVPKGHTYESLSFSQCKGQGSRIVVFLLADQY